MVELQNWTLPSGVQPSGVRPGDDALSYLEEKIEYQGPDTVRLSPGRTPELAITY